MAFQVSLAAKRAAEGRGEIDLLGVAEDGLPVVIELKRGDSTEPPAALLVQAAAYGIALQRAWWFLRKEWLQKVRHPEPIPTDDPLLSLDNCLVVPHIASASRARCGCGWPGPA